MWHNHQGLLLIIFSIFTKLLSFFSPVNVALTLTYLSTAAVICALIHYGSEFYYWVKNKLKK